jgi:hypothetical protein
MKKISIFFLGLVAASVLLVYLGNVDNELTTQDKSSINTIVGQSIINSGFKPESYLKELILIREAQKAVLEISKKGKGIPEGHSREPADLLLLKTGLCYDRSRVIEKILRLYGMETRHASIFSNPDSLNQISILAKSNLPSHAITEAKTKKGWIVVDSNSRWIALSTDSIPYDLKSIRNNNRSNGIKWIEPIEGIQDHKIYQDNFLIIYGLYSRHGQFYPPYNFIPDFNLRELINNGF